MRDGTFWKPFLYAVTDCVDVFSLSRWGSESPWLHLFHCLEETQMTTRPAPRHWQHTITQTDTVSFFHNDVVIWGACVCMGRASRLTSLLFAVGVLWLRLQPGLTPSTCSQTTVLNVHICSTESKQPGNQEFICFWSWWVSVFNPKQSKYKQKRCFCVVFGRSVGQVFSRFNHGIDWKHLHNKERLCKIWPRYLKCSASCRRFLGFNLDTTLLTSYRLKAHPSQKVAFWELRNKKFIVSFFE